MIIKHRSPRETALIGWFIGLAVLWGVGHFYVRKNTRGLVWLALGLALYIPLWFLFSKNPYQLIVIVIAGQANLHEALAGVVFLLWWALWFYQGYEAIGFAKRYNEYFEKHKSAPW